MPPHLYSRHCLSSLSKIKTMDENLSTPKSYLSKYVSQPKTPRKISLNVFLNDQKQYEFSLNIQKSPKNFVYKLYLQ